MNPLFGVARRCTSIVAACEGLCAAIRGLHSFGVFGYIQRVESVVGAKHLDGASCAGNA
jgi:hypothetical protein